jgi:hypothetical protein
VFAPTDAAFQAAGISLESLCNEDLQRILFHHVIAGSAVLSSDLTDGQQVIMASSDVETITIDNGAAMIGEANIGPTDFMASNGVVHVIDQVLMPPAYGIMHQMTNDPDQRYDDLHYYLQVAGFSTLLESPESPFKDCVLFAPTD